jgi:hypothetical protein
MNDLVKLAAEIVANEGRVGARGATLELARDYLRLSETERIRKENLFNELRYCTDQCIDSACPVHGEG